MARLSLPLSLLPHTHSFFTNYHVQITVPDDMEELEITFKAFDKNRDGKLSKDEMFEALQSIPTHSLSRAEINDIVERCDLDGDGELTLAEIITAIHK